MWYKRAKIHKEAASLGMYVESISKNLARAFVEEISNTFMKRSRYTQGIGRISRAIEQMQCPRQTKETLRNYFGRDDIVLLDVSYKKDANIVVSASYQPKMGVMLKLVLSNEAAVAYLQKNYAKIYKELASTIRHELQHYIQYNQGSWRSQESRDETEKIEKEKVRSNEWLQKMKSYVPGRKDFLGYLLNPSEVDARTRELYQQAKFAKMPFSKYLDDVFRQYGEGMIKQFKNQGLSDNEIVQKLSDGSKQFIAAHMQHARKIYGPQVQ